MKNNTLFVIILTGDVMKKVTNDTEEILKRIHDYTLEEIMGSCFGRYSKSIIQDRAIPDVRDGLKPVQRRILYCMFKDGYTYDKPYKKCAKTVGNVMGAYHPHGDSSIYDAMVRMSQWWKQSTPYIDMQGNNGSMDGDGPAAMRYTEARLAKISNELLKDIERDTVNFAPNYDDSLKEPTVLPTKFPNLLVNGANGISAGYATNIPPHNLGEIVDATIKRIEKPNCTLEEILEIVKGPDFPTGGLVSDKNGIYECLKTGRGKVIIRAKYSFNSEKNKEQIIINEIPFDVNKALLVKKINEIRLDKKIEGILDVRDESDRNDPERIAIDVKKDANKENILGYLFKNTELQISFNYNMVAIVNRRPMTLGILEILDAYIEHQKEVITRRTKYDLEFAKRREHIVVGLIKAISILDKVIATIRSSSNKANAIENLVKKFEFTEAQAKAIVELQLYRLTNTDITELEAEAENLRRSIEYLNSILENPEKLKAVIKAELKKVKEEYAVPRKSEILNELEEIKFDNKEMIPKEECIVAITKDGYIKRVSLKSYQASDEETLVKELDYVIGLYQMNTLDTILLFTNKGNYLYLPVYQIPELKWRELGKHISNIIPLAIGEEIIASTPVFDFKADKIITIFTKNGMVKRSSLSEFEVQRYSKPLTAIKLKDDDQVVDVTMNNGEHTFVATHNGLGLWYDTTEIPITGVKSSGVKSINLKNDYVVSGHIFSSDMEFIVVATEKSTLKRVRILEFEKTSRARKGVQIVRDVKTNPYRVAKTLIMSSRREIGIKYSNQIDYIKATEIGIMDRYSTGSVMSKNKLLTIFENQDLIQNKEIEKKEETVKNVSIEEIDKKIISLDDYLDNFHLE